MPLLFFRAQLDGSLFSAFPFGLSLSRPNFSSFDKLRTSEIGNVKTELYRPAHPKWVCREHFIDFKDTE